MDRARGKKGITEKLQNVFVPLINKGLYSWKNFPRERRAYERVCWSQAREEDFVRVRPGARV